MVTPGRPGAAPIPAGAAPGGRTPLAVAVFEAVFEAVRKKPSAMVRALPAAGADPGLGTPSAAETARMVANDQFLEWFGQITS